MPPKEPKGPPSAFILYCNGGARDAVKAANPNRPSREILRLLGDQWDTMTKDEKS
jgi:hypothetical protein